MQAMGAASGRGIDSIQKKNTFQAGPILKQRDASGRWNARKGSWSEKRKQGVHIYWMESEMLQ